MMLRRDGPSEVTPITFGAIRGAEKYQDKNEMLV